MLVLGHCAPRVGFSSPPHSPASKDVNQQTVSLSNIAASTSDLSPPALKSPTNLSGRLSMSLLGQTSAKEQPLFTLSQVTTLITWFKNMTKIKLQDSSLALV